MSCLCSGAAVDKFVFLFIFSYSVSLRQKLITKAVVMPRRSSLRRARPRPGCQSQESPVGAAPVLLRLPSQPVTTALSTQVLLSSQNCAGCRCCFSKVTFLFLIRLRASLIYLSSSCFLSSSSLQSSHAVPPSLLLSSRP